MSKEMVIIQPTGRTVYAVIANAAGQIWNTAGTPAFEAITAANWTDYDVALVEQSSTSGIYDGDFPTGINTRGDFTFTCYRRIGASPATTDPVVGVGVVVWTGSALVTDANRLEPATAGRQLVIDSSGRAYADLRSVLATALTEGGAGRLAAALIKFLDVVTPVSTTESVNQSANNNTILADATKECEREP